MTHEYIIPLNDTAEDWDEMFVAVIRKQEELIRCKDCKWCRTFYHGENMPFSYECAKLWLTGIGADDFCSKAERKGDYEIR